MEPMSMQDEILDFWFGPSDSPAFGEARGLWFRKDDAVDRSIRERFGAAVETAIAGGFSDWIAPRNALARVLLLDQFTRNIFRETAGAFAGDELALEVSKTTVGSGGDQMLAPVERWFLYMPFVHAEDRAAQERSLELFTKLRDETGLGDPLVWAERHAAVIRRFGRFPHRNAFLGRASTPEEIAYLAKPGSGF
jgi:uncharacterized protein (DUF924 family)